MNNSIMINDARPLRIPWNWIDNDNPSPKQWINAWQCESFVVTYLAKHPEKVDTGAVLAGIEVKIPSKYFGTDSRLILDRGRKLPQVDLVFVKGNKYYVVEAKEARTQLKKAMEEAQTYSKAMEKLLKQRGITSVEITPIGAVIDEPRTHLPVQCEPIEVGLEERK